MINEVIGVRLVAVFKLPTPIGGPLLDPALAPNESARYMGTDERGQCWLLVFQTSRAPDYDELGPVRWLKWTRGHLPFVEAA